MKSGGHTEHYVAGVLVQDVAHKAPSHALPRVLDFLIQIAGDYFRDTILKSLLLVVREGKVVRIGADPELGGCRQSDQKKGEDAKEARTHKACLLSTLLSAGPWLRSQIPAQR